MSGRVSIDDILGRARAALDAELTLCRDPPLKLSSDVIRERMATCLALYNAIERVEQLKGPLRVRHWESLKCVFERTVSRSKDKTEQNKAWSKEEAVLYRLLEESYEKIKEHTATIRSLHNVASWPLDHQSYELFFLEDFIDACFDAALACEYRDRHESLNP